MICSSKDMSLFIPHSPYDIAYFNTLQAWNTMESQTVNTCIRQITIDAGGVA
jgi:hypothetical protein